MISHRKTFIQEFGSSLARPATHDTSDHSMYSAEERLSGMITMVIFHDVCHLLLA